MSLIERVHSQIDLDLTKKAFLGLSAVLIILIPIDALWVFLQKAAPIREASIASEKAVAPKESESSYLAVFDRTTLFGGSAANLSAPDIHVSATELTKDFRLKGTVLGGEAEAIVEDARTQKTMFVKVGDPLGDLTVKEIKEGFIVLSYPGGDTKISIQ